MCPRARSTSSHSNHFISALRSPANAPMASIGRTLSSVRCDASRSARKSSTANISGGLSISVGFAVNATGLKSIVTACRAGDGHLLLISWQLKADGTPTRLADSGTGAEASVKLIVWGISPNGVCLQRLADGGSAASFTKCRARMPSWLLPELWLLSTYSSAKFMRTSRAASCLLLRRSGEPFRFTFFHCAGFTK